MSAITSQPSMSGVSRRWWPSPLMWATLALPLIVVCAALLYPRYWYWALAALIANHTFLTILGLWPRSTWLGSNLLRLPATAAARGEIAITFDDGPDPEVTPVVLDCLDRYGARASFFYNAERAAAHPALVREILRRGHSVENHSWHHSKAFSLYGLGRTRREIETSQTILTEICGRRPQFFRAPAGLRNPLLDPVLTHAGLRLTTWTRRGFDTARHDPERVLRNLSRGIKAGDILLLHDGNAARTPAQQPVVLEVLPRLLQCCSTNGLRAVSLPMAFAPVTAAEAA